MKLTNVWTNVTYVSLFIYRVGLEFEGEKVGMWGFEMICLVVMNVFLGWLSREESLWMGPCVGFKGYFGAGGESLFWFAVCVWDYSGTGGQGQNSTLCLKAYVCPFVFLGGPKSCL